MTLDDAVALLASGRSPRHPYERELAFAMLAGLLAWPEEKYSKDVYSLATFNHIVKEIKREKGRFDSEDLGWIFNCYDENFIQKAVNDDLGTLQPDLRLMEYSLRYDSSRYIADLVRFLLSYKPSLGKRSGGATIEKAELFVNYIPFPGSMIEQYKYPYSVVGRRRVWAALKTTSSLQYVRHYHCNLEFMLDYRRRDYLPVLSRQSIERDVIIDFFRKSLFVQNELRRKLGHSMARASAFRFPDFVDPMPCPISPLATHLERKFDRMFREYVKNENKPLRHWNIL